MKNRLTCFAVLGLLWAAPLAQAEDTPPQKSPTLAAALASAKPQTSGVTLAVDAAKVALPPAAVLPGDPMTGLEAGALYGQATQTFGSVLAVAPPTIMVVYAPPETPNPYDGMPPGQVMKLLAQTFTPAQWKAFMSPAGVAYTDMTGDIQPPLFQALFPDGHLSLIDTSTDSMDDPKFKREFPGSALTGAHLRLGAITSLALQQTDDPTTHVFGAMARPADSPPLYFMTNSQSSDVDKEYGAQVRDTIPNTPKPGQIAFDDLAFKVAVPLANIKTVDDLVTRIGLTTHREIYADQRYGTRLVTLAPSAGPPSAPAADLLQALAFCVGGTYRHVGPAYVLTDDIIGLGTKHVLWKAFEDKAQQMLPSGAGMFPTMAADPDAPYTVRDIPDNGDPLAMTTKQKDNYWKQWALEAEQSSEPTMEVTLPFAQLSPAQQEAAQSEQEANENSHEHTTLDGTVMVQTEPEVEIVLPGLTGRAIITQSYDSLLPYPALTPAQKQAHQKHMAAEFPEMAALNVPSPDFTQTLHGFSRRAARIAVPKTPKETTQDFAALQALGFNEAWLQIQPGPAAGDDALRAQLALAVAEGKKRGIAVFPDLSLLHWQKDVSPELLDCDIQGRTVFSRYGSLSQPTVSPFILAAGLRLSVLVRILGSVPGIGGMVWDDTYALGYEKAVPDENVGTDPSASPLGYAEAGRLAFLRYAHADPVDVQDNSMSDERAHVHVPGFDSDDTRERRLFTDWNKVRADTSQNFLHQLARALPTAFTKAGTRLPLLLPPCNASFTSSYGSWDDLRRPSPSVQFISQTGPDGQPIMGSTNTERMSSQLTYKKIVVFLPPAVSAEAWKSGAARSLAQATKQGSTNILLDLTGQPGLLQSAAK
jgi:hypothetical protein